MARGIGVMGGGFSCILEKGLEIPLSRTKEYSTNRNEQDTLELPIYEGTGDKVTAKSHSLIAKF